MEVIHCRSLFSCHTAAMFCSLQLHIYQTKRTIARRVPGRQLQWNNTCSAQKDQELPTLQLPHYTSPVSTAARPRWKVKPEVTGSPISTAWSHFAPDQQQISSMRGLFGLAIMENCPVFVRLQPRLSAGNTIVFSTTLN